jgi:hypothetical protein
MAAGGDIKAGRAYVELFVKSNALMKGLSAASAKLKNFGMGVMAVGGVVTGIGAAMIAPLVGAVNHFVEAGSELADMSARTKLSATTLAELGYAAGQTGASLKDVETAIRNAVKKGHGNDFNKLAESIASIEDPIKRAERAMEVFGTRSGMKLLPMIENLAELRKRAQELGIAPSDEDVAMADELGDKFDDVKASVMATVFSIGAALAPTLLKAMDTVIAIVVNVGKWVRENKQLIVTFAKIAVAVIAAGAAIMAIGAMIFGVGAVLGGLVTIVSVLAVAFKIAFIAIGAVIALVLSPIGLVIAALLLFTDTASKVATFAKGVFTEIKDVALSAFGGIADALMAGNIILAANILWTALKLLWAEGTTWLLNKWTDWKASVAVVFLELVNGIKVMWNELQGFLSTAIFATLDTIIDGLKSTLGGELFGRLDAALGGALSEASAGIGAASAGAQAKVQERRQSLADELAGQMQALNDAAESDKGDRQKQIDLLKKQLDALNKQAANERGAMPGDPAYVPGGGDLAAAPSGGSVFGTFSSAGAAALGGLGGGNEDRRTAKDSLKELREMKKSQAQLARAMERAAALGFI